MVLFVHRVNLGGEVSGGSPTHGDALVEEVEEFREPQIAMLDFSLRRHQDVCRLDVAVEHPDLVKDSQSLEDFHRPRAGSYDVHARAGRDHLLPGVELFSEGFPGQLLHRKPRPVGVGVVAQVIGENEVFLVRIEGDGRLPCLVEQTVALALGQ